MTLKEILEAEAWREVERNALEYRLLQLEYNRGLSDAEYLQKRKGAL
jgi:hypothetical protein